MIRNQFAPYQKPPFPPAQFDSIPEPGDTEFGSDDFQGGLILDANPQSIPDNALQTLNNGNYIRNQLYRRNGLSRYTIDPPDVNRISSIFAFFEERTGVNFIRVTANSLYKAGVSGWEHITGPALIGPATDPFSFTIADNRPFFSNNGNNVIQEIDPVAGTYAALGDAPKYKYIASAFDRVVGANLVDVTNVPYQIGWSGALNYGEWDPSVDISAGFTPLVNSPSDLSDAINGVFYVASALCIIRERSIWLGTNLPSATNPFNFFVSIPKVGCDCPKTVGLTTDGVIFYNFQKSSIYYFTPNLAAGQGEGQLIDISGPVKRAIKSAISSPEEVFASYNADVNTYTLFIPSFSASNVLAFSYDFNTKTWSIQQYQGVSYVEDIEFFSSDIEIDELTGTIAGLAGSIDSLGGVVANTSRFFGFNDGTLAFQQFFSGEVQDADNIELTDLGVPFDFTVDSKTYGRKGYDNYMNQVSVEFTPYTTGNISLYYTKDNGLTFNLYKNIAVTEDMLFKSQIIKTKKPVKCRTFYWRVISSDCMFSLDSSKIWADQGGISTK